MLRYDSIASVLTAALDDERNHRLAIQVELDGADKVITNLRRELDSERDQNETLKRMLAAEREENEKTRVKPLVDALQEISDFKGKSPYALAKIANGALAKINSQQR